MLRFLEPNLGMTIIGARVLLALAASPFVLAHEAHPQSQPPAANAEAAFLTMHEHGRGRCRVPPQAKPRRCPVGNSRTSSS